MEPTTLINMLRSGTPVHSNTPAHQTMCRMSNRAMRLAATLNGSYHEPHEVRALFSTLTGRVVDDTFMLFPPFHTDFGLNITVGRGVFINSGCHFQDQGGITIGDHSLIGHQVTLATLNHGLGPEDRGTLYPAPINIGRNVWIGAGATITPGITIGDDAIVGAGAVVTRNIPPGVVVAGVPAKIIRQSLPSK